VHASRSRNRGPAAWLLAAAWILFLCPAGAPAATKWGADHFPDVTLTTQDGVQVRFYEDLVKGKAVAVNVIYTSCTDECPLETARLAQVQRLLGDRMGRDIFFYSISIDPERDRPKVLKTYAGKFGAGPGWLFLTGRKDDIKLLARKLGLSRSSDALNRDGHASSLMLGNDPAGQWMRTSAVDNPRFLASTMAGFFGWTEALPATGYEQARPVTRSPVELAFESRCASCHTIGDGDRIGPDLLHVTARRERRWLVRYLKEPDKVLAERDATAVRLFQQYREVRMPNLQLGADEVAALLAYLEQRSQAVGGAARLSPGRQAVETDRHSGR
jgi:protein SCO1/2